LTELFKLHHSLVMEGTRGEGVEYRRLNIQKSGISQIRRFKGFSFEIWVRSH